MKSLIAVLLLSVQAQATNYYFFNYNNKLVDRVAIKSDDKEDAYKKATKLCYQALSKGVYPSETLGLKYIDICANPKSIDTKDISDISSSILGDGLFFKGK